MTGHRGAPRSRRRQAVAALLFAAGSGAAWIALVAAGYAPPWWTGLSVLAGAWVSFLIAGRADPGRWPR